MTPTRTDTNVASHRRQIYRRIIAGLQAAFDQYYTREPEFAGLHVVMEYPIARVDYPAIVVEYQNESVSNSGVGHTEWFEDETGVIRRWNHNRFEGTLNFTIYALSTLDRDVLADALVEVIRFGKLDDQLIRFYDTVFPVTSDVFEALHQIQLDTDQMTSLGDSAQLAPWQPEDVLVYSAGYSMKIFGGYYNQIQRVDWKRITHIEIDAYGEDSFGHKEERDHDHLDVAWNPPVDYIDEGLVTSAGNPSATFDNSPRTYLDSAKVKGHSAVEGEERAEHNDSSVVVGAGAPSTSESFTDN